WLKCNPLVFSSFRFGNEMPGGVFAAHIRGAWPAPLGGEEGSPKRGMEWPEANEPGGKMSKNPQSEWDAIAARYAQGESISRIAQSYGCTPPAIHYILKRSKQRTAPNTQQLLQAAPQEPPTFTHRPAPISGGQGLSRPFASPVELPRAARSDP